MAFIYHPTGLLRSEWPFGRPSDLEAVRMSLPFQKAMEIVYHSRLHEKLQDVETGLYLEGSEYLYGLLKEERGL